MTKSDTLEILEGVITSTLTCNYPELDRQRVRVNVRSALMILNAGLLNESVFGMTGGLNEFTNQYVMRTP
jgi:hypothetical protein